LHVTSWMSVAIRSAEAGALLHTNAYGDAVDITSRSESTFKDHKVTIEFVMGARRASISSLICQAFFLNQPNKSLLAPIADCRQKLHSMAE